MVQTVHSEKIKNFEIEKSKNLDFRHIRAHAHARVKNAAKWIFLCMCYAIKYRMTSFEGICSPVERISTLCPNSCSPRRF